MTDRSLELVVRPAEARSGDKQVVRLAEATRRRLGVLSGDTVVVEGERPVALPVWPADSGLDGDSIGLDPTSRRRAGLAVGETVTVRSWRLPEADSVTLRIVDPDGTEGAAVAVDPALLDRPVETGDRLRLDGATVRVLETVPEGPVRVVEATRISVIGERSGAGADPAPPAGSDAGPSTGVTYADIGGLDDELELVREAVELPLGEPEVFARLGIEPPNGVLLHGPPGTGKTLIVEAIATEVDAAVYHVSGPEITSKYKGESEERLRAIFERARETAPSIVFFDEIDAIAGKRDDQSDMENRVVAQLLSLMDGLEARGNVVVIGATNRLDTLDPALRRPGRFDREIEIGVPDESGRRRVLDIHTSGVPVAAGVDLDRLAARTYGFVGADLRALVTEAALHALRRARASSTAAAVEVGPDDFEAALAAIDPSAMREYVVETPATTYEDVGGLEAAKRALEEAVEWPLLHPGLFEATGAEPPSGVLLYGPPGTGKTLLARALAGESGVNFVHVAGPELIDKYVGESERAVREVFERARQAAPTIVFFDEIDAIASRRRGEAGVGERVVSQLLTELDGLTDNPNRVVLAATNRKDALDPALLRPGRLEVHVEVPEPDREERLAVLGVHARDVPLGDGVDLASIADRTAGLTGADLAALVREATMRAIREAVADRGLADAETHAGDIVVGRSHLEAALAASPAGRSDPDEVGDEVAE